MKIFRNLERWPLTAQVVLFVAFCCVMGALFWSLFRDIRESWRSAISILFFVEFVPWIILFLWLKVTRTFSFWTRWVVPLLILALCVLVSVRAEWYIRPGIRAPVERSLEMFAIWYLAFFLLIAAWIVGIPMEEAITKLGIGMQTSHVAWRLGFALAGMLMIAITSILAWPVLFTATALPGASRLVSVSHDCFI